ncbi:hypothetical protein CPB84DRAFT_1792422, partial [Gymnopilus junonius]
MFCSYLYPPNLFSSLMFIGVMVSDCHFICDLVFGNWNSDLFLPCRSTFNVLLFSERSYSRVIIQFRQLCVIGQPDIMSFLLCFGGDLVRCSERMDTEQSALAPFPFLSLFFSALAVSLYIIPSLKNEPA